VLLLSSITLISGALAARKLRTDWRLIQHRSDG